MPNGAVHFKVYKAQKIYLGLGVWNSARHLKTFLNFTKTEVELLGTDNITQWDQVAVVLQHHVSVQIPLFQFQALPLFLWEVYGHIFEQHQPLKWQPRVNGKIKKYFLEVMRGEEKYYIQWPKQKYVEAGSLQYG